MAIGLLDSVWSAAPTTSVERSQYVVHGKAPNGGLYNSHLVSVAVMVALGGLQLLSPWLAVWIVVSLAAALLVDTRSWKQKVKLTAIPGQLWLYLQVFVQAAWDAFPFFVLAYFLYVCAAPYVLPTNFAISSFVMLYGFYTVVRTLTLIRYLWLITFRWENAGRTFSIHQANLKSSRRAIRHVIWTYFQGNVGLVVRCATQVVTIGLFEWIRQQTNMDLTQYPAANAHLTTIFVVAVIVWAATSWFAVRRMFVIFYRTHRTFHASRPLYDSIHRIHHRGVFPTPLDSGTISPAEFWITEMALPIATVVPNWWFSVGQIIMAFAGHLSAHDTGSRLSLSQHHLNHHRLFEYNYGLTPAEDEKYGTLYTGDDPLPVSNKA